MAAAMVSLQSNPEWLPGHIANPQPGSHSTQQDSAPQPKQDSKPKTLES